MDSFLIEGGLPLSGEVTISGSKNAVLPILAATLLTSETCIIRRVPDLSDVGFMLKILQSLGAEVTRDGGTLTIRAAKISGRGDYELIRKMRGSICILGPLLARLKEADLEGAGGRARWRSGSGARTAGPSWSTARCSSSRAAFCAGPLANSRHARALAAATN
jgi:UDP-N-acetylglucosamine 1-carboxyvinyltransferase